MAKKLLALVLSVLMLVSLLPMSALADGNVASVNGTGYGTLAAAINAATDEATVSMLQNYELSETIVINKDITLDLAGKTVTTMSGNNGSSNVKWRFEIAQGKTVTIQNGTISNGITIDTAPAPGYAPGASAIKVSGTLTLKDVTATSDDTCIWVQGGTLNVDDTVTVTSKYSNAIATNGSVQAGYDSSTAVINITGGVITSTNDVAVYAPAGTFNISGGTITGATGVYQKGGTVKISGGTITGNGNSTAYKFYGNGGIPTGDGFVVDTCGYPYGVDPAVSITAGTISSENAKSVATYVKQDDTTQTGSFTAKEKFISGGTFTGEVPAGDLFVEGKIPVKQADGSYAVATAETGKDYSIVTNSDGSFTVGNSTGSFTITPSKENGIRDDVSIDTIRALIESVDAHKTPNTLTPINGISSVKLVIRESAGYYPKYTITPTLFALNGTNSIGYVNLTNADLRTDVKYPVTVGAGSRDADSLLAVKHTSSDHPDEYLYATVDSEQKVTVELSYCSELEILDAYTVTFNGNGADGGTAMDAQNFTAGVAQDLTANTYTRTGYTFQGWGETPDATTAAYANEGNYPATESKTLYAIWKPITFTVWYRADTAAGYDKKQEVEYASGAYALTADAAGMTLTGSQLDYWKPETGTEKYYAEGHPEYPPTDISRAADTQDAKVYLTAKWYGETHDIIYHRNAPGVTGDTETYPDHISHGAQAGLLSWAQTGMDIDPNYTFAGWVYLDGTAVPDPIPSVVKDIDVYASWTIPHNTITVTTPDNATLTSDKSEADYKELVTLTVNPASVDYTVADVVYKLASDASTAYSAKKVSDTSYTIVMPAEAITVSANVIPNGNIATVGDKPFADLTAAIVEGISTAKPVVLVADVTMSDMITIASGTSVTINLNNHTLTTAANQKAFQVEGTLTLTDGSTEKNGVLKGNDAVATDGGIVALSNTGGKYGTFIMEGGKLTDGQTSDTGKGGAVYVPNGTTFTFKGGEIAGNTAGSGDGVYVASGANFTLDGAPAVTDDTVYLASGAKITLTGALTNSAPISITMQDANGGVFTDSTVSGAFAAKDYAGNFKSSDDTLIVRVDGNELKLTKYIKVIAALTDPTNAATMTLTNGSDSSTEFVYAIGGDVVAVAVTNIQTGYHLDTIDAEASDSGYQVTVDANPTSDITVSATIAANTYTVKFNKNGANGSETMADFTRTYGETGVKLTANTFTNTGYTFGGWVRNPSDTAAAYVNEYDFSTGELTEENGATVTLYALWTTNGYTVVFDKNNDKATGSMSNQTRAYGDGKELTANAYTLLGYEFQGWATTPSGAKVYNDKATDDLTTDPTVTEVTLYAVWKALPRTLHINYYGGKWQNNGTYDVTYDTGANVSLDAEWFKPEQDGWTLSGWKIEGKDITYYDHFTMPADETTTLIAQWTQGTTYTVTYKPGAHSTDTTEHTQTVGSGNSVTLPSATYYHAADGYYFAGWKDQDNDTKGADAEVVVNSDLTYTAQWAEYPTLLVNSDHGTVVVDPAKPAPNKTVNLTITPNPGWTLPTDAVTVVPASGDAPTVTLSGGKYSFPMTTDSATATVAYTAKDYTVTCAKDAGEGTVSASNSTATVEDHVVVTFAPAEGYELTAATVNDVNVFSYVSDGSYTIDMDAFVTYATTGINVHASFAKTAYSVTSSSTGNGTVSTDKDSSGANFGDIVTVTVEPATGYEVDYVVVNDTVPVNITNNQGTFSMPNGNATVTAAFKYVEYEIETAVDPNGSGTLDVTTPNTATFHYGEKITLTATPAAGKTLSSITAVYDTNKDVTVTNGKFTMPAGKVTVTAHFVDGVAAIGSTYYLTLDAAFEAVKAGETIVMLADAEGNYQLGTGAKVTLDLNGFELKGKDTVDASVIALSGTAEFTLTDSKGTGRITGRGTAVSALGGGVYVASGTTFNMFGGEISGVKSSADGAGVYVDGTMNMKGSAKVTGNFKANGTTPNNVYLKGAQINIVGDLTDGAAVGIVNDIPSLTITYGFSAAGLSHYAEAAAIFSSDAGKYVKLDGGEAVITSSAPTVTLEGDYKVNIYINGVATNSATVAAGNTVTLTLNSKPDDVTFLKGFTVKQGNNPVEPVNMTVASDGTFSGATFQMVGSDVTVTPLWATVSEDSTLLDDAGAYPYADKSYYGVFIQSKANDGSNVVSYTVQQGYVGSTTYGDDLGLFLGGLAQTDNPASTIVYGTTIYKWDANKGWIDSAANQLVTVLSNASKLEDNKEFTLVIDGVPVLFKLKTATEMETKNDAATITVSGKEKIPAIIVTENTTLTGAAINEGIAGSAFAGQYIYADGTPIYDVSVYVDNQKQPEGSVTLNGDVTLKLAVTDGTYAVGNYHNNAYTVLADAVTATSGVASVTGKDFSPIFFMVPAPHNITYVADAAQGGFTTAPATANYGDAVDIVVTAKTGYHLTDLYYYKTGDDSNPVQLYEANKTDYTIASMPEYDITVVATFEGNVINVILNPGTDGSYEGTASKTVQVTYGKPYGESFTDDQLPRPTSSLTFDHWVLSTDETKTIKDTDLVAIDGEHTLVAKYVGTYVTLTYDANAPAGTHAEGTIAAQHATAGDSVSLAAGSGYTIVSDTNPSRTYTFVCWTNANGDPVTGTDFVLNHDTTLYAKWKYDVSLIYEANAPANEITSGALPLKYSGTNGDKVTIADAITRDGYQFVCWSTDANDTDVAARIAAGTTGYVLNDDVTLYAIWKVNSAYQCIVYFDTDGGTAIQTWIFDYTAGEPASRSLPTSADTTKEHYSLVKWHQQAYGTTGDVNVFDPGAVFTPTAGKTYTMVAEWKEDDKAEITYVLPVGVNGTKPDDAYAYVGDTYVPSATKFTKDDQHTTYTHDGWVVNEADMYVAATTVYNSSNPYKVTNTNKITFYPHFTVVPEGMHTITFDLAASDASWKTGSAFASGAYTDYQDVEFALPTNADVERTGWVLDGWEDTPNGVTYRTTQKYKIGDKNATLTAVWKKEAKNAEITTTQEQIATGTYSFYYTQKLDARTDLGSTYESINEFFYEAIDTSNVHEQTSSKLPDGLKLSEDGIISGIPTKAGEFHFYVGMRDAEKQPLKTKLPDTSEITSVKEFVIVINPLDVKVDLGITTPFSITYGEDDPTDLKYTSNLAFYAKNTSGAYVLVGDTATDLGNGNYVAYSVSGDTVTMTFTNSNATGVPGPDDLVFKVTSPSDQAKSTAGKTKAGSYLLDVTLPEDDNYTFAKVADWLAAAEGSKYYYTVDQKNVGVTWTDVTDNKYTSLPIVPTATINDVLSGDICVPQYAYEVVGDTTTLVDGMPVNAADYKATVTATGDDSANYYLIAADTVHTFTIAQRPITDAVVTNIPGISEMFASKQYSGYAMEPDVTITMEAVAGTVYKLTQDTDFEITYVKTDPTAKGYFDASGKKPVGAGEYTATVTGIGNFTGFYSKGFTITLGVITIKDVWANSKVYGADLDYGCTSDVGQESMEYHWYKYTNPNDTTGSGQHLGTEQPTDVGYYSMQAQFKSTDDYAALNSTEKRFEITKKPFDVTWTEPGSLEYDGTAKELTAAIASGYVVDGDTIDNNRLPKLEVSYVIVSDGRLDGNGKPVGAGKYKATASIAAGSNDPANYELTWNITKEFEITPKSIESAMVTINPDTAVYAATELSADAYVTVTDTAVSANPLVRGTDYEITWEGDKGGTYLIDADAYTPTITGKGDYTGYKVVNDTFTITPAPVTVTWTEVPQVYVDNNRTWTYTYGDAINPTPILDGVIGSDDCTAIASIYDGTSDTVSATPYCVGQHTARAFLTGEKADNYKIDPVNDLSIFVNKLKIKVTLQDNYKIFGDADPVPLSTFTTNAPNVNFAYEITRDADFGEDVGNHAIKFVITSMATSNYELDDTSKTTAILTINPKSIAGAEISFNPTSAYYTGTDTNLPTVIVTLNGYTISADAGYNVEWTWGGTPVTKYKDGGEYTVKVTGKNNYEGEQVGTATFTVYPVAPTVNTKPTSKGTVETSGSAVELINPGTATGGIMMYSLDGGEFKSETPKSSAVGTHTVTWKVKGTAPNYYDIDGDTTLTVEVKQSSSPTPTPIPTPTPGPGGKEYNLKLAATTDGTLSFNNKHITDNPHSFPAGTKVTIDVVPASYYRVERVTYSYTKDGKTVEKELTADANGAYILEMPSADTVVTATFVPKNNNDPSVGKVTIENYTNGYVDCDHTDDNCPLANFEDLKDNLEAWYHDGIHYCLENGIMQGFGTPFFLPDAYTTRAQVVTTLWNIAGHPIAKSDVVFDDVKEDDWFYDAIMWAAANHIVNGYGDGNFGPNDLITHEQVAKIFYGYAAFYGFDVTPTTDISGMPGANTVHEWALPYVQWGVATKLCCGVDGNVTLIAATANVTRAELATTILNFCTRVATKPAQQ